MKITITNALEADMPEEMIANCEYLLARRIQKNHPNPSEGEPVDILYSESDPRMEKEDWGADAYGIYFTIAEVGKDEIKLDLSY